MTPAGLGSAPKLGSWVGGRDFFLKQEALDKRARGGVGEEWGRSGGVVVPADMQVATVF